MQDFLTALQALCDRHNVKLGPQYTIKAGRWRSELVAFRLDDLGRVVETQAVEPISPARVDKIPNAKADEARPVFGERAGR